MREIESGCLPQLSPCLLRKWGHWAAWGPCHLYALPQPLSFLRLWLSSKSLVVLLVFLLVRAAPPGLLIPQQSGRQEGRQRGIQLPENVLRHRAWKGRGCQLGVNPEVGQKVKVRDVARSTSTSCYGQTGCLSRRDQKPSCQ